jgi:pyridoxal phosphate enzyme (YggS family)
MPHLTRPESIADRIASVQERMAAAEGRGGRRSGAVRLVAVSKTQPLSAIAAAAEAGLSLFGENRVEEGATKALAFAQMIGGAHQSEWHMVGHLQSRKVADVLPWCSMVQSIDSLRLAERLDRQCLQAGTVMPVLVEVNIAGEASKYGFDPAELPAALSLIAQLRGLRAAGLMTVAPMVADPELVRPVFAALAALRDDLQGALPQLSLGELSMGMSGDFEVAIEEGATLVRIGRAIFGERA